MASINDLLKALKEQRHEDIIRFITDEPKLVNATHLATGYSLMKVAITAGKPLDLIQFIVSQPDFSFAYLNVVAKNNLEEDESNIDVILKYGRKDVLEVLLNDPKTLPKVILNHQQLTYESAVQKLGVALTTFNKEFNESPNSSSTERAKAKVDNLKIMIPMLAEATIKEAVAKDSSALCARLDAAGVDLEQPLSSGDRLIDLLDEQSNPRVLQWLGAYFAKKDATRPVIDPDCLNKERKLRAELDAVSQRFFAKQTEILEKAAAARLERMEKTANPSNPGSKM